MDVILLERVEKLGQMGDLVKVRDGYARNFLLPHGKALRATNENKKSFETRRADLEARNLERRSEAETVGEKLNGESFTIIRQAGESGQLYGSVSARDISDVMVDGGFKIDKNQVMLERPIKMLGLVEQRVQLHPELFVTVTINVARSQDEAERQARGENVLASAVDLEDEAALNIEEVFEEDVVAEVAEEIAASSEEETPKEPSEAADESGSDAPSDEEEAKSE